MFALYVRGKFRTQHGVHFLTSVSFLGLVRTKRLQSQSSALAEPFRYDFYKCSPYPVLLLTKITRLGVDKVKPKGWFKYFLYMDQRSNALFVPLVNL